MTVPGGPTGSGTVRERVAVVGANGLLARAVLRRIPAGSEAFGLDLPAFDVTDRDAVERTLARIAPTVVINCAADTDVDGCESREARATAVNATGVAHLAAAVRRLDATLVQISTDFVFDGEKSTPYVEGDRPAPLSAYGRSKLAGERAVLESGLRRYFVVRTSWLFGAGGANFVDRIVELSLAHAELRVVADQVGSPTFADDLARALYELLALANRTRGASDGPSPHHGTYHVANRGACSRHELAAAVLGHPRIRERATARSIVPIATADLRSPARRPGYSALSTAKYEAVTRAAMPTWQDALARYLDSHDPALAGVLRGDP